ncbi:hypothetical protein RRG08_032877 [Elysia crispata]|uniref:Uncharacterized protein n=1 Tax=Elysia crispata TaxID=231223 RepID=A0AAE0ZKJ2_9GAST|nr:hypothetical protein RRG08_032877 [Elysia crispata]
MSEDLSILEQLPQFYHLEESDHMDKPMEIDVTGEVPHWINGSLYRNGAGLFKVGPTAWKHFFDGYAVLQRWTICDGKITYQASILDSENYNKSAKHRKLVGDGFGGSFPDPCDTIFGRLFNRFIPSQPKPSDNTNVNFMELGDRLFALTESTALNEINANSLTVKKKHLMSDYMALHIGTAHPHQLKDGTVIYNGTNMMYHKAYNFVAIPPQLDPSKSPFADAKLIASVPSRWKMHISYTHSFGLTDNFLVHLEQPLSISLPRAMCYKQLGMKGADIIVPHEGESMDIMLVSRATGERLPITYKAPEGVVFHFSNCYEESNHVVCDVCFFPKGAKIVQRMYNDLVLEDYKAGNHYKPLYTRFVLPLSLEKAEKDKNLVSLPNTTATATLVKGSQNVMCVTPEYFQETISADFPAYNYKYNGLKHRYAYTSTSVSILEPKLVKFDLIEKTVKTYIVSENHCPGEPVFVARPGATREDDGVILSTIIALNSSVQSFMVVLDASTFEELARASLPPEIKMSFTFHGIFTDKKL